MYMARPQHIRHGSGDWTQRRRTRLWPATRWRRASEPKIGLRRARRLGWYRQVRRDWPGQGPCTHDGSVPRRCGRTCLRQQVRDPSRAKVLQVQEERRRSVLGTGQRGRVGLPQVPHRGTHLELAGQRLGPAEPPADVRLTRTADTVKRSSKLFLLSADDTLHALASTAFMRMLRQEDLACVPDFAGQRVR